MMKKFVKVGVAFLIGLLLGSCSKPKEQKMQEVRFYANCIETGSMTRATDHNEILNLIESTYVTFAVNLYTNEETNTFTLIEFGKSYTVPIGTFKVTGYNRLTMTGVLTSKYTLAKAPSFYTDSYVTIEYGTYEYFLPVQVRAAAIVIDRSEVLKVEYKGQSGSYITMPDSDLTFSDHYGVFFINGYLEGSDRAEFRITPKSGANKETYFTFCADQVNTGSATYAKLEMGKYYVLHPNPVTEISGVSFSLDIPAWECGLE